MTRSKKTQKDGTELVGAELAGRYELTEELGRGGMGVVYRARDPVLNRDVAIKVLPRLFLTREAEQRFRREAQLVAQLDHPAIVPIHDFGHHEGSLFFVMPMVHGTPLRILIKERHLTFGDTLDIVAQVAEALDYSHSHGVIHRDIKPENVMVSHEEAPGLRIRVMDFGLAVGLTGDRLTKTGNLLGTMAYFSPEQATSADRVDGRSDLYALGVILYECVVGSPPFSGTPHEVLYRTVHEIPESPRDRGAAIDEVLEGIILDCLDKEPARRPARGAELATKLRAYLERLDEAERAQSILRPDTRVLPSSKAAGPSFVGRQLELGELQRRLNAALGGECQLVVVGGEPGVGKTRLLLELEALALARRIRVLRGRFSDQEANFPYQGFCELIQDYYRSKESASSSTGFPDLRDLASELLTLFPVLSEVVGIRESAGQIDSPAGEAVVHGPGQSGDRTRLFELLARTLARIQAAKPTVLLLENLHGADVSIEALQYVVHRLGPTPTLILASYRTNEVSKDHPLTSLLAAFADSPRFYAMILGPLGRGEHRVLVESLLRSAPVSDELAERLYEATEGNPFFTVELVRSLIDSGAFSLHSSGTWTLSGEVAIAVTVLPATIQQALQKRLEGLPEDLRRVLATAAVLGKRFELDDLAALAEDDEVEDTVERLVRFGFLEEDRRSRGDWLSFSSSLIRDVLYNDLSRRKRRLLHRRHASRLEERNSGRLERVYAQLVHHFSEGDVADKTVRYALELARRSLGTWSSEEAIRAIKTALEFVEDVEDEASAEGELRLLLAQAQRVAGHSENAHLEAGKAVRALEKAGDLNGAADAALVAAETAWQGRQVQETRRWTDMGIELARAAGKESVDRDDTAGAELATVLRKLLTLSATVANLRGDYEQARLALEEAERLQPDDGSSSQLEPIAPGGTLVTAMASAVRTFDPAQVSITEDSELLANVFETLFTSDDSGNWIPLLCEAWEGSSDSRTFRLTLRGNVRFSDGTPLTAALVKASLERTARVGGDYLSAAYSTIEGWEVFASGTDDGAATDGLRGIRIVDEHRLNFHLSEPLPFFPALLSNVNTAIVREAGERLVGTGPFLLADREPDRVILERNPDYWRGVPPMVDRLVFRTPLDASAIAEGLRHHEIDLGRDLLPKDLEEVLRVPQLRAGLVEAPKKNVYYICFNRGGPLSRHRDVRRALAGAVRVQDVVWRTLGRFAQPAVCLIPPGLLGHDAGRRRPSLSRDDARALLAATGLVPSKGSDDAAPLKLAAAVHPLLLDRYSTLTEAVFDEWKALGVEVEIETTTMESYASRWRDPQGLDFLMGRWVLDYDDPDNVTSGLLHSRHGVLGSYLASPEADSLLERASQEQSAGVRQGLYRRFETYLAEEAAILPLFHDIDYRIATPDVRGLRLLSSAPFVSYSEIGKVAADTPQPGTAIAPDSGTIYSSVPIEVESLDPAEANFVEVAELISNVMETLTRVDSGARIVPALAEEVVAEEGGRRFRIKLRDNVRFHDGRRLTARDVRFSFERLLRTAESRSSWALLPIRGATAFRDAQATEIEGLRIVSATEMVLDLERPLAFYPAMLTHPTTSIVPEGTERIAGGWEDSCIGTGPFRVVRFEPRRSLELEAHPHYWRTGYPRCERLVFQLGLGSEQVAADFRAGRLSVAAHLRPAEVEELCQDAELGTGYHETPGISTYFLVLNTLSGPFTEVETRHTFVRALAIEEQATDQLGRLGIPAYGMIPPGLLGHESERPSTATDVDMSGSSVANLEVTAWVHPIYFDQYGRFWESLVAAAESKGIRIRVISKSLSEMMPSIAAGEVHFLASRWLADYPDSDSFVNLAHSKEGMLGSLFQSEELDQLIEKGRAETDPTLRHALYREIGQIFSREAFVVPLFHEQVYRFVRPEIHGLQLRFSVPEVAYEELSLSPERRRLILPA